LFGSFAWLGFVLGVLWSLFLFVIGLCGFAIGFASEWCVSFLEFVLVLFGFLLVLLAFWSLGVGF